MTKAEIESEIKEFESLLNDSSVPEDEKEMAREAIAELKEDLKKLEEKPAKKKAAPKTSKPKTTVKAAKDVDPDCDDLLDQYNKRKARQKKSAKKAANTSEAQKVKKAAEKNTSRIIKKYKAGDLTPDQIKSIINELKEDIAELEKLLKSKESGKKKVAKKAEKTETISDKHYKEFMLLGGKGYHKFGDMIYGEGDNAFQATQGEKGIGRGKLEFGVAYFYENEKSGVMQIDRELMDWLADGFSGFPVTIYTNAGVDLHSSAKGKYKNLTFERFDFSEKASNPSNSLEVQKLAKRLKDRYGYEYEIDEIVSEATSEKQALAGLKEFEADHKRHEDDERREYASDYMENGGKIESVVAVVKTGMKKTLTVPVKKISVWIDRVSKHSVNKDSISALIKEAEKSGKMSIYVSGQNKGQIDASSETTLYTSGQERVSELKIDGKTVWPNEKFEQGGETCGCGGKLRKIGYKTGGEVEEEEIDYFEQYDKLPADVKKVLDKYNWGEDADYPVLEKMRKEVNQLGWDFEYYLDGVPYDLKKMSKAQRGMWIQRATERMKQKGTEGAFTAQAKKAGMKPIPFAKKVLANPDDYELKTVRRAQFVANANPEMFKSGGSVDDHTGTLAVDSMEYLISEKSGHIDYKLDRSTSGRSMEITSGNATRSTIPDLQSLKEHLKRYGVESKVTSRGTGIGKIHYLSVSSNEMVETPQFGEGGRLDPQQKKAVRGIVFNMDDPEEDWEYIDKALKQKFRGDDYKQAVAYAKSMFKRGGKVVSIDKAKKSWKEDGRAFFHMEDQSQYEFEKWLKSINADYGDTSQTGTDVVFYDATKFDSSLRRQPAKKAKGGKVGWKHSRKKRA